MLNDFLALVFPLTCAACGNSLYRHERSICTFCTFHLPQTHFHLRSDNPVARMFWGRVDVRSAAAFFYFGKKGRVQRLIHQLKYKGNKEAGTAIGKLYGAELSGSPLFNSISGIVPVPLHRSKQRKRGYNQSEYFARGLAESMQVECLAGAVTREVASETQTRKSRYKRWENVAEVFRVKEPSQLESKHILLVDDVITTGATIEACAAKLLQVPGVMVSVAGIAWARL